MDKVAAEKVVFVTAGSRGLRLVLAQEFASRWAKGPNLGVRAKRTGTSRSYEWTGLGPARRNRQSFDSPL